MLVHVSSRRAASLGARTVVGRFPNSDLVLDDRRVSGHHALFLYTGGAWALRVHATTNGTFLDDVELSPGRTYPLQTPGSVIRFGTSSHSWRVEHLGPPSAVGVGPEGAMTAEDGVLALPHPEHVEALVWHDGQRWKAGDDDDAHPIEDGASLDLPSGRWTIHLPANLLGGSMCTSDETASLNGLRMRFVISANGDEIRRCLVGPAHDERELRVRRHTHLLLELADAWLRDRSDGPATERGWVEDHVLLRRLGLAREQLHLLTHRARGQLRDCGAAAFEPIIDSRGERAQRQLRLVCREVFITVDR